MCDRLESNLLGTVKLGTVGYISFIFLFSEFDACQTSCLWFTFLSRGRNFVSEYLLLFQNHIIHVPFSSDQLLYTQVSAVSVKLPCKIECHLVVRMSTVFPVNFESWLVSVTIETRDWVSARHVSSSFNFSVLIGRNYNIISFVTPLHRCQWSLFTVWHRWLPWEHHSC
jgi:hypothetical protein